MNAGLVRLALRRALGGGGAWLFALLAWVALSVSWAPPAEDLRGLLAVDDPGAVARALTRSGVWSLLLLALAPWVVFRAAATVPRWRQGEVAWLASAPASRARVIVSTAAGQALATWALVAAAALLGELAAARAAGAGWFERRAPAGVRLAARLPAETELLGRGGPLALALDPGPRAAFVRLRVLPVAGGSATRVRMTLARGSERRAAEALVFARTELRVPVPPGQGPLSLELELAEPGAGSPGAGSPGADSMVALVGGSVEALERVGDERAGGAALALRALVALLAWQTLALGLGAWMDPRLAALLALSLAVLSFTPSGAPLWPGADLPRALTLAGEGVLPPRLGPGAAAGLLCVLGAGLGLARAGLWTRRGP